MIGVLGAMELPCDALATGARKNVDACFGMQSTHRHEAHPSSLSASASGSETARKGVSLLLRMKATWRAPVNELRLQLLPSDKLELSESFFAKSEWDDSRILCRQTPSKP